MLSSPIILDVKQIFSTGGIGILGGRWTVHMNLTNLLRPQYSFSSCSDCPLVDPYTTESLDTKHNDFLMDIQPNIVHTFH